MNQCEQLEIALARAAYLGDEVPKEQINSIVDDWSLEIFFDLSYYPTAQEIFVKTVAALAAKKIWKTMFVFALENIPIGRQS